MTEKGKLSENAQKSVLTKFRLWSVVVVVDWREQVAVAPLGELGHPDVYRHPFVPDGRCLQDDYPCSCHAGYREDPQEQSVQHHCHELPIFFNLELKSKKNKYNKYKNFVFTLIVF